MVCSLCDKPVFARGMCQMHYTRWKRHGDTSAVLKSSGGAGRARVSDPSYRTVHKRLVAQRGKATDYLCVDCKRPASHWSYKNGGGGKPYTADLNEYETRCVSCHKKLDSVANRNTIPTKESR
jgi:hypothetical protein